MEILQLKHEIHEVSITDHANADPRVLNIAFLAGPSDHLQLSMPHVRPIASSTRRFFSSTARRKEIRNVAELPERIQPRYQGALDQPAITLRRWSYGTTHAD